MFFCLYFFAFDFVKFDLFVFLFCDLFLNVLFLIQAYILQHNLLVSQITSARRPRASKNLFEVTTNLISPITSTSSSGHPSRACLGLSWAWLGLS